MQARGYWALGAAIALTAGCSQSTHRHAPPRSASSPAGESYAAYSENLSASADNTRPVSAEDRQLAARVRERLGQHPYLGGAAISVDAAGGVVTLSGTVNSDLQLRSAEQAATKVSGVRDVKSQLTIRDVRVAIRNRDKQMQADLERELKRQRADAVKLQVKDGVISLSGTVRDWDVYDAVLEAAYRAGPTRIVNNLDVRQGAPEAQFVAPKEPVTDSDVLTNAAPSQPAAAAAQPAKTSDGAANRAPADEPKNQDEENQGPPADVANDAGE